MTDDRQWSDSVVLINVWDYRDDDSNDDDEDDVLARMESFINMNTFKT
jgi:hypothetical protein